MLAAETRHERGERAFLFEGFNEAAARLRVCCRWFAAWCFNEAAACSPRKLVPSQLFAMIPALSFNEAAACSPRKLP
jgi:hypothetical protein